MGRPPARVSRAWPGRSTDVALRRAARDACRVHRGRLQLRRARRRRRCSHTFPLWRRGDASAGAARCGRTLRCRRDARSRSPRSWPLRRRVRRTSARRRRSLRRHRRSGRTGGRRRSLWRDACGSNDGRRSVRRAGRSGRGALRRRARRARARRGSLRRSSRASPGGRGGVSSALLPRPAAVFSGLRRRLRGCFPGRLRSRSRVRSRVLSRARWL